MARPLGRALGASLLLHGLFAAAILALLVARAERVATQTPPPRLNLVYIARSHAAPLSGGGGSAGAAAPRPVEIPGHRPPTVALAAPPEIPPAEPLPTLSARVDTTLAASAQATGTTILAPPGPGDGGRRGGIGSGIDDGIGPGSGGKTGGGPVVPGGDVSYPTVIREWKPDYSPEALQARTQGIVTLDVVVLANGTVGRVTVARGLHPSLDQKAVEAARKWLFSPARRADGQPVDVLVTLVLEFRLH